MIIRHIYKCVIYVNKRALLKLWEEKKNRNKRIKCLVDRWLFVGVLSSYFILNLGKLLQTNWRSKMYRRESTSYYVYTNGCVGRRCVVCSTEIFQLNVLFSSLSSSSSSSPFLYKTNEYSQLKIFGYFYINIYLYITRVCFVPERVVSNGKTRTVEREL